MPRPSPSPFPTNRPNFFVEPSTTIESLRNSSTRCEPLASRCSSTPSKDPLVEKEEYHPKCALSSRHSGQSQSCDRGVVADLDIDIVAAGLEEERLSDRIKLARGQRLNLGDRVHRGLNSAGGHARVEDGHVRSKVRLHRVTETERANREQTTEKNGARHMRRGELGVPQFIQKAIRTVQ